jgi:hypothetical protein
MILKPLNLTYKVKSGKIVIDKILATQEYNSILLTKTVTLAAPYTPAYPGAPTDRISVQYAVSNVAGSPHRSHTFPLMS